MLRGAFNDEPRLRKEFYLRFYFRKEAKLYNTNTILDYGSKSNIQYGLYRRYAGYSR